MVKIDKFGADFLLLALRIGKHIKGYIDFYIGPENLKQLAESESITSPKELLRNCEILLNSLSVQGYDKNRERYLEKHLIAMRTSIEDLLGIEIPFKEKFLRLYDVELQPINESELHDLIDDFKKAYNRTANLAEHMKVLREKRKVPEDRVFLLFKNALNITKNKTKELFGDILPHEEKIIIKLIDNKTDDEAKWAYYEWYLGNFQSRLEINPKYNMYWTAFLSVAAHEGYPGHHMNFVLNEKRLYQELNHFEHSILMLKSPKLVICEGIADLAVNVLFSYKVQAELSSKFLSNGTVEDNIENLKMQNRVKARQSLFWYNLAYHALFDGWNEEKLFQYGTSYEIFSQEDIKNIIKLFFNPAHSTTAFLYNLGSKLIMNKYGEFPSVKNFRDILLKPFLPSDLV